MGFFITALAVSFVALAPLLFSKSGLGKVILAAIPVILINYLVVYLATPTSVGPLLGDLGVIVMIWWLAIGLISAFGGSQNIAPLITFGLGVIVAVGISFISSPIFRAGSYAAITGPIETRTWTSDIQPKDPSQMRIVDTDTARYIARKAVAQAGTVGSQFQLDFDQMTLQRKGGRLIYAVPLDYSGFKVWTSTDGSPGWIEIDAQDAEISPRFVRPKTGVLTVMPAAYRGYNLERAAREAGFGYDIANTLFVIDEAGAPHWILIGTAPSLGFNLPVVQSVLDIDPVTGKTTAYDPDKVPAYVDVIVPGKIVTARLNDHGRYAGGWWNNVWTQQDIEASDSITLVSGNDGQLLWVSGISQPNRNNDALVAMVYTDARTGKSTRYAVPGGATDEGLISAVDHNADVKFRNLHASIPQTYNVDGVMTALLSVTNAIGAFQGVAFVEVANPQEVAFGPTPQAALSAYKAILLRRGQQISLENGHGFIDVAGVIDRIAAAPTENRLIEFKLVDDGRVFAASANDYVGLSLARPGDRVRLKTIDGPGALMPVRGYVNESLPLQESAAQKAVTAEAVHQQDRDLARKAGRDLKAKIDTMSPEEIEALQRQAPAKP